MEFGLNKAANAIEKLQLTATRNV